MNADQTSPATDIEEIQTPTERLITLLRFSDADAWAKVDATKEAIEDGWDPARAAGPQTGIYQRIDEVWREIEDAHVPEPPRIPTVSKWYAQACAWPTETRVEGASFRAHTELVGSHWKNRQGKLSKLVADNRKRNGDDAILDGDQVRLWKSTQTPAPQAKPWEDKFWSRLDSLVHSRMGPKSKTEWKTAIDLVKALLDDMREEAENAE